MIRQTSTAVSVLDEALVGLWRARRMTALSVALISLSVFLVGTFFLVAENLRSVVDTVRDETAVTVFLRRTGSEADRAALEKVARDSGLVAHIRYVSAEEARARFSSSWKALAAAAATLPVNPFPASLELDLARDALGSAALPGLLRNLAAQPMAEEVQFDVEWIRRLRGVVAVVRAGGLALGVLLAFGAAFTIANVVRLTILLHRDEIDILRLVGAPELLIRGPFVLGGLAQGLVGGVVAVGSLALSFHALLRYVALTENALLGVFVIRFLRAETSALLVAGGLLAGLIGGAFAVRRRNME